jgi:hypothetical protein
VGRLESWKWTSADSQQGNRDVSPKTKRMSRKNMSSPKSLQKGIPPWSLDNVSCGQTSDLQNWRIIYLCF